SASEGEEFAGADGAAAASPTLSFRRRNCGRSISQLSSFSKCWTSSAEGLPRSRARRCLSRLQVSLEASTVAVVAGDLPSEAGLDAGGAEDGRLGAVGRAAISASEGEGFAGADGAAAASPKLSFRRRNCGRSISQLSSFSKCWTSSAEGLPRSRARRSLSRLQVSLEASTVAVVAGDLPFEAGLDAGGAEDGWLGGVGRAAISASEGEGFAGADGAAAASPTLSFKRRNCGRSISQLSSFSKRWTSSAEGLPRSRARRSLSLLQVSLEASSVAVVAEDLPSEAGLDAGGAEDGGLGAVGRAEAVAGGGGVSTGTAAAEAPAGGFKAVAEDLPSEAGLDAGGAEDGGLGAVGRAEAIAGGG